MLQMRPEPMRAAAPAMMPPMAARVLAFGIALGRLTPGAARGDPPQLSPVAENGDMNSPHKLRSGIVLGFSLGAGFGGASGYPNNSLEIGNPDYYSSSGWMGGTGQSFFVMGAIADYLNAGFWAGSASFVNRDWRSSGGGGGLRLEAFPLAIWPRTARPPFAGVGLLAQLGVGSGSLHARSGAYPDSSGTQSFLGVGAFYEWSFGKVLGGHFAAGPSLEYDAIVSTPFERHGLLASGRVVFYGGP
jgi:hypothetical protein